MTPGAPSRVSALSLPSGVPAHTLRSRHRSSLSRSPTSPQPFQARAGLRDEAGRTRRSALHGPLTRRRRRTLTAGSGRGVCRRRAALARHPRTTSQPARSSPSRRAIPPAPLWRRSLVDPMRSARDAGPRAAHAGNAGSGGGRGESLRTGPEYLVASVRLVRSQGPLLRRQVRLAGG